MLSTRRAWQLQEIGDQLNAASCLEGLAAVAVAQGNPTWAARLLGAAEAFAILLVLPSHQPNALSMSTPLPLYALSSVKTLR